MTRRIDPLPLILAFAWSVAAAATPAPAALVLTGEVHATEAEAIRVPPSDSSPVVLRSFAAEGASVQPGDVLVRIDPGQALTQVDTLRAQIEQGEARAAKEISELELKALDAERALLDAELALAKARIDAGIPRQYLSALDADRYRGELERATREHALQQHMLDSARAAVERRRRDAGLETDKLRAQLAYNEAQVGNAEQRATRAGVVVHGFDRWQGKRFDAGSSGWPGNKVGEVVGDGPLAVRAYALEPERVALAVGQSVRVHFDALPQAELAGRIRRISGAPEAKAEWGDGRWFTIEIELDQSTLPLLPGMSAQVVVAAGAPA